MNVFQEIYDKLRGRYRLQDLTFSISDVSEAFRNSDCRTLRNSSGVYLGRLSEGIGLLTAMVRNYELYSTESYASEYASRHLSDDNEQNGIGRYTIASDRNIHTKFCPCYKELT